MEPQHSERLNKYLALQLGVSRREADALIEKQRVTVNGKTAQLGGRFKPSDSIAVDGTPLTGATEKQYVRFHKPVGYVCSRKAQGDNPTIYSLLPKNLYPLKPVGRLDKDSSGLLLLTNDGDFAFEMTHPKFYKQKTYLVRLDHELAPLHQQMINDFGVQLEDGPSQLTLERQHEDNRHDWIVQMSEGRNRQVRRTFAALGYTVTKLHRIQFGTYGLHDLSPGKYEAFSI